MKRTLRGRDKFTNKTLVPHLISVWETFPQIKINSLVNSFIARIQMMRCNEGLSIQPFLSSHINKVGKGNMSINEGKELWSDEEDRLLLEKVNQLGKKWSIIEPFFPKRNSGRHKTRAQFLKERKMNFYSPKFPKIIPDIE